MSIPSMQLQKKNVLCTEVIVSKIWITGYRLRSQLCYMTAASQWTIVEIEILATVSSTCGCQPFSCRCSQNVTHSRKEIDAKCLSKESIPAILFGNSKDPTPTRSYCIMPIPSLQIKNKIQSHAQKQRVWSLSCGLQDLLQCNNCALSCALWLLQTNDSIVEIELLATVSWTSRPAFQLPMFAKCDALPKRD